MVVFSKDVNNKDGGRPSLIITEEWHAHLTSDVHDIAVSGMGKTTHMLYWMRLLGDKLSVINGDKPIIRFFDGVPYAYGTPWCGKENLNTNDRVILSDICLIERGEVDEATLATQLDVFSHFIKQIYRPSKTEFISKTFYLAGKLFKFSNLRKFKCRKNISAAKTAYKAIFNKDA